MAGGLEGDTFIGPKAEVCTYDANQKFLFQTFVREANIKERHVLENVVFSVLVHFNIFFLRPMSVFTSNFAYGVNRLIVRLPYLYNRTLSCSV